ncbi:MAG: extracellular solute-binding protein [Acidimicrobiia bacterium]|nr:extracellular solute-binding protein [Acidimicrobiia bacterium]
MRSATRVPNRLLPATVALAALTALTAACSSGGENGSVTIYSGRTEDLIGPILEDFTAETGIDVEVRYGDSADLALLIEEEGDRTPADVFLSQSPGAVGFLEAAGRLAELPTDVLDLVPASVRDDEGRWVGFSGRQRVLVYNPELVAAGELPTSIFELTDPSWGGRLAIAPANSSFQDFVTTMRAEIGDDETGQWLEGLVANDVRSYPKNSAIVAAVGRGEVAAGLVNHYYNFRALDEDPQHPGLNHQFAVDDLGGVLIVTGAAIVEGTDRSAEAEQLVTWLLGEQAQRYFADETFEYPLAPGVEPAVTIPPASFAEVGGIDYDQLGGGLEATRDLITSAGLEG